MQGRIVKGVGGFYYVDTGTEVLECKARGLFRHNDITPLPGDWAEVTLGEDGRGYITQVTRKNRLLRPPVSNVDRLFVVVALASPSPVPLFVDKVVSIAESKAALGAGDAFLRGVLCNFLVCLAVWMAAASKRAEGKVIALFFPILLFVLCGYEHCIANLYYLPAGAFAAAEYGMETTLTLAGCLENLAAVTLGNLVGGAALGVGYRFVYLKE